MIIEVSGIPVKVMRKDIKNMHLYVKPPEGHVEVSVPMHLSDESIALFVRTKLGWIRTQQEKFRTQRRETPRQYISGETIYVWGKQYYLRVEFSNKGNSLVLGGDTATLTVRKESTAEQREKWIHEWYRAQLKEKIEQLMPKWEKITDLHPSSWQTKYMTTKWGTCNTKTHKIWLNLQLAKKPVECLEYVILHELTHLRVKNHGPEFVAILDQYMPYWREVRKLLNDSQLDFLPKEN